MTDSPHFPAEYFPTDEDIARQGAELGLNEEAIGRLQTIAAQGRSVVEKVDSLGLPADDIERIKEKISQVSTRYPSREPWPSAVAFAHTTEPPSHERRLLMAYPQTLFRPEGLWLWGADETTIVHDMKVGNLTGYKLSHVPLPGLFFQAGLSFKDFEALLEDPPENWSHARLRERPAIPSHQKIRMNVAEIGNNIVLDVEGPLTHAVMWGVSVH